jgi:hypothetical protein
VTGRVFLGGMFFIGGDSPVAVETVFIVSGLLLDLGLDSLAYSRLLI